MSGASKLLSISGTLFIVLLNTLMLQQIRADKHHAFTLREENEIFLYSMMEDMVPFQNQGNGTFFFFPFKEPRHVVFVFSLAGEARQPHCPPVTARQGARGLRGPAAGAAPAPSPPAASQAAPLPVVALPPLLRPGHPAGTDGAPDSERRLATC